MSPDEKNGKPCVWSQCRCPSTIEPLKGCLPTKALTSRTPVPASTRGSAVPRHGPEPGKRCGRHSARSRPRGPESTLWCLDVIASSHSDRAATSPRHAQKTARPRSALSAVSPYGTRMILPCVWPDGQGLVGLVRLRRKGRWLRRMTLSLPFGPPHGAAPGRRPHAPPGRGRSTTLMPSSVPRLKAAIVAIRSRSATSVERGRQSPRRYPQCRWRHRPPGEPGNGSLGEPAPVDHRVRLPAGADGRGCFRLPVPMTRAPALTGELDNHQADAAGGPVDHDRVARTDIGGLESMVRSYAGEQQAAGLLERKRGRFGQHARRRWLPPRSRRPLGPGTR